MGLPLRDIVQPQEIPWEGLSGRILAVDAYNCLYQFLATIRQPDGQLFTDREGHVTSHLMGLLYRTTSVLAQGVRCVWVFDGKPPGWKAGTIRGRIAVKEKAEVAWKEALAAGDMETARRKASATSRLTPPMVDEAIALLSALGIPSLRAPSEGEAQAATMARAGVAWAAASEDYDCLLFGAPRLVRGLAARTPKSKVLAAQIIDREATLKNLGIDGEELITLGLLVGTDYNEGAAGFGPKRALKLVREHLGFDATLRKAGLDPEAHQVVADLFRAPSVVAALPPTFRAVDPDSVGQLLVEQHGFSADRVRSALARVPAPSVTPPGHQTRLDLFAGADA
ncbi:MAG: flap endonuclease-1 [Thermoplasmata archaeon]|nr:flap endonuclease-1 [Thermoplasmata archaeon]